MSKGLTCLGCAVLLCASLSGQSFEAADIHVSPKTRTAFLQGPLVRGNLYQLKYATMIDLISKAYGVDGDDVWGGPTWLELDQFDVMAKMPPGTKPDVQKEMLQALLAERFKLVVKHDSKPQNAFALTAGKHLLVKQAEEGKDGPGGCKYAPITADGGAPGPNNLPVKVQATCSNMTMKAFAEGIRNMPFADRFLNRAPVLDKSGLTGSWDITLTYSVPARPGLTPAETITMPEAIEKQLGLKLEPAKTDLPVISVESVNRAPSPNTPDILALLGVSAPPTEFEVATVKLTPPETKNPSMRMLPGGQLNLQGVTLKQLIQQVWQMPDDMIFGAPKWMEEERFDILAKAPASVVSSEKNGQPMDFEVALGMVKALLAERFQMKSHLEERPINAYTLLAVKPKMKPADPTSRTRFHEGPAAADLKNDPRNKMPILGRLVTVQNMTMADFAERLQFIAPGYVHSPVLDATGLKGSYDFSLSFSPVQAAQPGGGGRGGDAAAAPSEGAADPNGAVTLSEAIDRQLGLKLELQKRPVQVLVIDHIERKPTEN